MYSVVIVDDNEIAVEAIYKTTAWKKINCEVIGMAYDGISGIEIIQNKKPDIAIVDIHMPGIDGLEMIEKLKKTNKNLKFVIISGFSYFEYAQKAIKYGVKAYLLKPVMSEDIENALLDIINEMGDNEQEVAEAINEWEKNIYDIYNDRQVYIPLVSKAIEYVERNMDKNITLNDVCSEYFVSVSHFSKSFKKETGIGFSAYVTMVKMRKARMLMENPQNRINEVANMVGYNDYSYFFQVFKKQYGYSPRDFRLRINPRRNRDENN